jgi:glycosyltransferase involved in cell wall biosynthesis
MKIAHVVDSMEVGGVETLVSQICTLQRDLGHEPIVFVLDSAGGSVGSLGDRMLREGFDVRAPSVGQLPGAIWKFYRILKELRPDVVHLHNPRPTSFASLAAKAARVPSVVSTRHSLAGRPRRRVTELKYALAARFCDRIVGICDATVMNLMDAHPSQAKKMVRVYNGILPIVRTPRERWPAKQGFTLVFVGRLAPVKNLGILVEAFRGALQTDGNLRLWVVGDGSERQRLEDLAHESGVAAKITFWGEQLDPAPFFSAADAFIMSSRSEGLPISLLQAFSAGLPAIVTDVGGMAEAVRLVGGGLIVSNADAASMTEAILRLAGSSVERELYGKNALAGFEAHFTLGAVVAAYAELYAATR